MAQKGMAIARNDNNIESICKQIHDSIKDEKIVTKIFVSLSQYDCREVRETYMKIYGQDLIQEVSFLANLMLTPFERDAIFAREAIHQYDAEKDGKTFPEASKIDQISKPEPTEDQPSSDGAKEHIQTSGENSPAASELRLGKVAVTVAATSAALAVLFALVVYVYKLKVDYERCLSW